MEAKNDYLGGDVVDNDDLNQIADNANDGGGFRDDKLMGEAFTGATTPQPAFFSSSDNKLYQGDANDDTRLQFDGFVLNTGSGDDPAEFQGEGIVGGFSGLDEGETYYLQDAVGTIGTTPGTYPVIVGRAISATELLIIKKPRYAAGTVANLSTSASGTNNNDVTVTTGFKPRKIILHYYIRGKDRAEDTANYEYEAGKAVYINTGLKFKDVKCEGNNSCDLSTTAKGTSAPSQGTSASTAGIQISLSIASVSATGFVIRRQTVSTDGGGPALAQIAYEAYE